VPAESLGFYFARDPRCHDDCSCQNMNTKHTLRLSKISTMRRSSCFHSLLNVSSGGKRCGIPHNVPFSHRMFQPQAQARGVSQRRWMFTKRKFCLTFRPRTCESVDDLLCNITTAFAVRLHSIFWLVATLHSLNVHLRKPIYKPIHRSFVVRRQTK
jgi:hypothetical protein